MKGRLHSIETMGLVDGPGIRTVFFLQGCPLKCLYCHNPDSQCIQGAKIHTSVEEVVNQSKRFLPYYTRTGGGVTFSGGEPLMQGRFLADALKALKAENIHTCVDTSGYGNEDYFEEILQHTDLVILDLKHSDDGEHVKLTGRKLTDLKPFLKKLHHYSGKIWIRHVMLPGYTDQEDALEKLLDLLSGFEKKVERIEILPYHKHGVDKYSQMDLTDPLESVKAMDPKLAKEWENWLNTRFYDRMNQCALRDVV
jgi:pyruvate formate lyase activating enzyme